VSNTWWFSRCLNDIWVSHLRKSQTTPTILHNEECYPSSYDMLGFCARGGQIRMWRLGQIGRWHVVVRHQPLVLWVMYMNSQFSNIYLICDHVRGMMQPILASNLVFIDKRSLSNLLTMLSTYTTSNDNIVSSYNTALESRESLIMKPRSTLSSTPISLLISYLFDTLVLFCNC
jgi:hypothetical protein